MKGDYCKVFQKLEMHSFSVFRLFCCASSGFLNTGQFSNIPAVAYLHFFVPRVGDSAVSETGADFQMPGIRIWTLLPPQTWNFKKSSRNYIYTYTGLPHGVEIAFFSSAGSGFPDAAILKFN